MLKCGREPQGWAGVEVCPTEIRGCQTALQLFAAQHTWLWFCTSPHARGSWAVSWVWGHGRGEWLGELQEAVLARGRQDRSQPCESHTCCDNINRFVLCSNILTLTPSKAEEWRPMCICYLCLKGTGKSPVLHLSASPPRALPFASCSQMPRELSREVGQGKFRLSTCCSSFLSAMGQSSMQQFLAVAHAAFIFQKGAKS